MKIARMLGKEGRTTIPFELRLKLGFQNKDVIIFEDTDDKDVILIRRIPYCTVRSEDEKNAEQEKILEEFIGMLTPQQKICAFRLLRGELTVMGGQNYA